MKKLIVYNYDYYKHNDLYIENPRYLIATIQDKLEIIIKELRARLKGKTNSTIPLFVRNSAGISNIENFENGIVITIDNTIPYKKNMMDDFSQVKLFIMNNDEIRFAFSLLDDRIEDNKEYKEEVEKNIKYLYSLMGKQYELIPPMKRTIRNGKRVKIQKVIYDIECEELIKKLIKATNFDLVETKDIIINKSSIKLK